MTNLSPAAQAVLDAAINAAESPDAEAIAAAALRAAADQICMKQPLGSTDTDAGVFAAHHAISTSLLAIADELDGQ
jgi:hypothetical protein